MDEKQHGLPNEFVKKVKETILDKKSIEGELKKTTNDGKESWFQDSVMPILDDNCDQIGEVIVRYDITQKKVYEKLSITDPLTRLYNRRHFDDTLTREISRTKRDKTSLSFIIFDIDYFKKYNDANGHKAGDQALVSVSRTIKNLLKRGSDYAFRLGGEEFGIIFSRQDEEKSFEFAEKIRKKIEDLKIVHSGSDISKYLTISLGLIYVDFSKEDIDENGFYTMADNALYMSKENGRNCVSLHKRDDLELF